MDSPKKKEDEEDIDNPDEEVKIDIVNLETRTVTSHGNSQEDNIKVSPLSL